jgi:hypothetical protein
MNRKNKNQIATASMLMRTDFVRIADVHIDIIILENILKLL